MSANDRRLIEDFLPIKEISAESSREKSLRHGHISTLHLWWARRPLVACRAAVYASLVPADFHAPKNGPENKRASLGRANAAKFLKELCRYPGNPQKIEEARQNILKAHRDRTGEDSPPKVLDCFAGGGSIPLEALRLGCDAYALELNPVAHLIELCTLVYPQKYGKPDPNAVGCDNGKWAGLAKEVEYWGKWVLEKVKAEIGDLYPPIPIKTSSSTGVSPVGTKGVSPVNKRGFQPVQENLFITQRNLPHWQMGGSTYFVTFRTRNIELPPAARKLVLEACLYFENKRYHLWSAVVMPDHVHLLLTPIEEEKGEWYSLSEILHSIKSFTAKKINKILNKEGNIWQDESFDRIVRDEKEFLEKWEYIRNNPVKKGLCKISEKYESLYESTGKMPEQNTGKMPEQNTGKMPEQNTGKMPVLPNGGGGEKLPIFTVVRSSARLESRAIEEFGFDPGKFSKAGNSVCVFCGTVADNAYVKQQAQAKKMGQQLMAVVCTKTGEKGKVYLSISEIQPNIVPDEEQIQSRISKLGEETGLTIPDEPLVDKSADQLPLYGITRYGELFTPRQLLTLLTFTKWIRKVDEEIVKYRYDIEYKKGILSTLGMLQSRVASQGCALSRWNSAGEKVESIFSRQAIPMVWDFAEVNLFGNASGNAIGALNWVIEVVAKEGQNSKAGTTIRGSAAEISYNDGTFDAVITDPPYYDNISYAALSDFFYVWLKRSVGFLYPEHFASELTPKRNEIIADSFRHTGKQKAKNFYEEMMFKAFQEIYRVLKPEGILTMVYAHKTVAGWSTLVNALRQSGFVVSEAWPLATEMGSRLLAMESSALASSIFLVARKRGSTGFQPVKGKNTGRMPVPPVVGNYTEVKAELEDIVRERVQTLWEEGITGADLIIACVGAGLKAFTQYEKVELPNGEEVSSERFLTEVEGVVQETILEYLFGAGSTGVSPVKKGAILTVDAPTRFYILWRYAYGRSEIDAGEAIVFSYPLGVELDGAQGLSTGKFALLEKKGKKYRLKDFTERGNEENLGIEPRFGTTEKPLIDVLHRLLWVIENRTLKIKDFLDKSMPNIEELRLVAQAISGSSLQGGGLKLTTDAEQSALQKLLSNWRSVVEDNLFRRR